MSDLSASSTAINTTTLPEKTMLQMTGVLAEFKRKMIRDRAIAGLAVLKATGKNKHGEKVMVGRPKVSDKTVGFGVSVVQRLVT